MLVVAGEVAALVQQVVLLVARLPAPAPPATSPSRRLTCGLDDHGRGAGGAGVLAAGGTVSVSVSVGAGGLERELVALEVAREQLEEDLHGEVGLEGLEQQVQLAQILLQVRQVEEVALQLSRHQTRQRPSRSAAGIEQLVGRREDHAMATGVDQREEVLLQHQLLHPGHYRVGGGEEELVQQLLQLVQQRGQSLR